MPLDRTKVEDAIKSLKEAKTNMNTIVRGCPTCGLRVYENRLEHDQNYQIDAFIERLTHWIGKGPKPEPRNRGAKKRPSRLTSPDTTAKLPRR